MPRLALFLAACLASAGPLQALEKASAQMERERPTSDVSQVSLKPLFLFNMRGRGDPFMAYPLLTNMAPVKFMDINDLVFSGIIGVNGKTVALFKGTAGKTYFLRGSNLYDPENKVVEGIRGAISQEAGADKVVLVQGERKLAYTSKRFSKRLEANSQR